jgi:hypothetical protein
LRRRATKAVEFVAVTAAVIWVLLWWETQTGWGTPDFWFGTSFLALGWVIVLGEFGGIYLKLPDSYHRLQQFEADGRLYRRLGVRVIKRFVVDGDYMNRSKRARTPGYRIVRTRSDAFGRERRSRTTEVAHLLHLLLLLPAIALATRAGRHWFAAGTILLLTGFDLYPILLQRYNRARVQRLSRQPCPRAQTVSAG